MIDLGAIDQRIRRLASRPPSVETACAMNQLCELRETVERQQAGQELAASEHRFIESYIVALAAGREREWEQEEDWPRWLETEQAHGRTCEQCGDCLDCYGEDSCECDQDGNHQEPNGGERRFSSRAHIPASVGLTPTPAPTIDPRADEIREWIARLESAIAEYAGPTTYRIEAPGTGIGPLVIESIDDLLDAIRYVLTSAPGLIFLKIDRLPASAAGNQNHQPTKGNMG